MFEKPFPVVRPDGLGVDRLNRSTSRPGAFQEVSAIAPAKINIYFQVGDARADGYHDVLSLYCAVSLYDRVKVTRRRDGQFTVKVTSGNGDLTGLIREIPSDHNNLAIRAAALLAGSSPDPCGIDIEIHKSIPVAGGMAGGSADAAATLVACNVLWGGENSLQDLERLGARLGADVPFALRGSAAVGHGTGTELEPVAIGEEPLWWVVAPAYFGLSTAEVFGEFSRGRKSDPAVLSIDAELLGALRSGDPSVVARHLRNDLQGSAIRLSASRDGVVLAGSGPLGLERTLRQGMKAGALAGLVSGSGPSIIFLVSNTSKTGVPGHGEVNARHVARCVNVLRGRKAPECIVVKGPVDGAKVVSARSAADG